MTTWMEAGRIGVALILTVFLAWAVIVEPIYHIQRLSRWIRYRRRPTKWTDRERTMLGNGGMWR